jgi:hypothetical protein
MLIPLLLFLTLSILSLAFAVAIAVESRRSERKRCAFLQSIGAPAAIAVRGWKIRIFYLAGSILLLVILFILPYTLGIFPLADG